MSKEEELTDQESSEETASSEDDIGVESESVNEIDLLKEKVSEWQDKYMRAYADFDNTKKRLEREKHNAIAYSNENFAKDMISVMDSFDGAIASIDSMDKEEASSALSLMEEGIRKTHEQLKKMLEKNGIKEIDCSGGFDPNLHQAIMQVDSDALQSGAIAQILQKGYTIKDQVLRPAMVSTVK
ncbi:MAG: nucleotide exchange factor GrpE [Campylobacterales bacterium]|nr:nucleotide exchange factor GrpE [Campylobacterales bacterium]